jgi:hypothetical protein
MILEASLQDFSAGSGVIPGGFLESIYHSFMDDAFVELGRNIVIHLPPAVEQDVTTQGQPQSAQYNPFFGRVVAPQTNTRGTGTRVTPRDVIYTAQIRIGPTKEGDDMKGIGDLKANQAAITLPIEALNHVKEALSFTVEGRRYSLHETRPIGFSERRYIIVKLDEINEQDIALGENDG